MGDAELSVVRPVVVGANHRSSSLMLRDRLFLEDEGVPAFLARLSAVGIKEALLLSTCDRVEVQALHADPEAADAAIRTCFAERAGDLAGSLDGQCYTYMDDRAVEQIFSVAASLDSQIVGEPQILGQVKAAHRIARETGMVGRQLESLMQAAYSAAKRVRTETTIGERPVSIAAAVVDLARDIHGDLAGARGFLIGVGDMGHLIAEHLLAGGLKQLTVTHPLVARASTLAQSLDCHWVDYEGRADAMAHADIVVTALGRRDYALNVDMVISALKLRRMRPVFLVDVAVPSDIDPAVNRVDSAFLYELSDLERIVSYGRASREIEAEAGRVIISAEVTAFQNWWAGRAAVPTVKLLRQHAERLREEVLVDSDGTAEKATRLLLSRLLHDPSKALRHAASGGIGELEALERATRKLFKLEVQRRKLPGRKKD